MRVYPSASTDWIIIYLDTVCSFGVSTFSSIFIGPKVRPPPRGNAMNRACRLCLPALTQLRPIRGVMRSSHNVGQETHWTRATVDMEPLQHWSGLMEPNRNQDFSEASGRPHQQTERFAPSGGVMPEPKESRLRGRKPVASVRHSVTARAFSAPPAQSDDCLRAAPGFARSVGSSGHALEDPGGEGAGPRGARIQGRKTLAFPPQFAEFLAGTWHKLEHNRSRRRD